MSRDIRVKGHAKRAAASVPDDGFARLGEGDLSDGLQIPGAPQPEHNNSVDTLAF